jgi:hypothetical protein
MNNALSRVLIFMGTDGTRTTRMEARDSICASPAEENRKAGFQRSVHFSFPLFFPAPLFFFSP